MLKSAPGVLALAAVPALLLSACTAGMSSAETDACNRVLAWHTGGQDPDDFDRAVAAAQEALDDAGTSALTSALSALASSVEDERAGQAEAFIAACDDEGWELPEG